MTFKCFGGGLTEKYKKGKEEEESYQIDLWFVNAAIFRDDSGITTRSRNFLSGH